MVVLLEGSLISTEELWSSVRVTIGFLVTSLNKSYLARLLSLAGWPALGRVLVVLGDLQCCRHVLVAFPRSVPRHNPVSVLY